MTIVAGFRFSEGVLLCADTEVTHGPMKFYQSKIYPADLFGRAWVAFGVAGFVKYAEMTIQKIQKELASGDTSYRNIKQTIENFVLQVYIKHIYILRENERPTFDLLVSVWTPESGTKLLSSTGTAVTEVDDYECHGTGLYLAKYLIEPLYSPTMNWSEAVLLAVHVLQQTKKHAYGVGGKSEFFALNQNGEPSEVTPWDDSNLAEYAEVFRSLTMRELFFKAGNPESTDEQVKQSLTAFSREVGLASEKYRAISKGGLQGLGRLLLHWSPKKKNE